MNNVKVSHNQKQNGIELKFDGKPATAVLDSLKQQGFKWSRFNKVWYSRVSEKSIETAKKYGSIPDSLLNGNDHEADNISSYVDAQERAMFERD